MDTHGSPEIYVRTLPEEFSRQPVGHIVLRLPFPMHILQLPPGQERLDGLFTYEESLRAGLDIENYYVDVSEVEAAIRGSM